MTADRRSRKRLATRQAISDAATRLFFQRGFDKVTVDEIAAAADVGRMTVFNHFPRKEDMFFDRDEEGRAELVEAVKKRRAGVAPLEALRLFAHRVVTEEKPYVSFFDGSRLFIETIEASESLKARARAIRDELTELLAVALAEAVGRTPDDPDAHLAASVLVATWGVAFLEAHRTFRDSGSAAKAQAVFVAVVDRGAAGLKAMMAATPYAGGRRSAREI
jgi:AcrR family transcriptional regulator